MPIALRMPKRYCHSVKLVRFFGSSWGEVLGEVLWIAGGTAGLLKSQDAGRRLIHQDSAASKIEVSLR